MQISIGPTGSVVTGHLFDCSKSALEEKLRRYDSLLYIRWNPKKRRGMGCWEVRRRPEKKTAVHKTTFQGMSFLSLEYVEQDMVHHVVDAPFLSYRIFDWLIEHDTTRIMERKEGETDEAFMRRLHKEADYRHDKFAEKLNAKASEDMRYMVREHKREIKEFKEALLSGFNPARIAQYWGRS